MGIVWRPQMSIGNDNIDADHRYLLTLINLVELSLRYNDDFFDTVLEQLVEYTHEHFKREELIQLKIKYLGYNEHKFEHLNLLRSLTEIVAHLKKLKDGSKATETTIKPIGNDRKEEIDELVQLLRSWIIDHVLGEDMKMKPFLKQFPANLS